MISRILVFVLSLWISNSFSVQQFQIAAPEQPKAAASAPTPEGAAKQAAVPSTQVPSVVNMPSVAAARPAAPVDSQASQTILYQLSLLQSQNAELKSELLRLHRRVAAMSQALLLMHRALGHRISQPAPQPSHPAQPMKHPFFYPYWLLVLLSAFIGFLAMKEN